MKPFLFIVLFCLTITSCSQDPKSDEPDQIISCYEDTFKDEGLEYRKTLEETILAMNELGFPIKSGQTKDIIEVLEMMKNSEFPTNVDMESEAVFSKLRIYSLQACVYKHKNQNDETATLCQKLDNIVAYDVDTKAEFDEMANSFIIKFTKLGDLPAWTEPFAIHLCTQFYTQYWRINNKQFYDVDVNSENNKNNSSQIPPPPPPTPPKMEYPNLMEEEVELPEEDLIIDSEEN